MAIHRSPGHIVYTGEDRREVEVLDDHGTWHYGEQRSWDQADDGTWSAMVTWTAAPGENRLNRFPADRIRLPASLCPRVTDKNGYTFLTLSGASRPPISAAAETMRA